MWYREFIATSNLPSTPLAYVIVIVVAPSFYQGFNPRFIPTLPSLAYYVVKYFVPRGFPNRPYGPLSQYK